MTSGALPPLPAHRELYIDGRWIAPQGGYSETFNPSSGQSLGKCAIANSADVDIAVKSANKAFGEWRKTSPAVRALALRAIAAVLRANSAELALLDAANCGNPVRDLMNDAGYAASQLEFFAGLATEIKGSTIPMGENMLNYTKHEPIGVCARILAFNHPLMYVAQKLGAPLVAGNTVVMKPPEQAPLSAYRFFELIEGILPPGVANLVTGGIDTGEALVSHPLTPVVTLIGSAQTGRAIARAAGDRLKHVLLELGGKNALIVYPDADIEAAVAGAIKGMNFAWAGQSCGSTSRVFVHQSIYEEFVELVAARAAIYKPGIATEMSTTMGAIIDAKSKARIISFIEEAKRDGARVVAGGGSPADVALSNGHFVEATVLADVSANMRVAREEIFGPVLSMLSWDDETQMFDSVANVDYGLTAAVFTKNIQQALRAAERIDVGSIAVNGASFHFLGAPFGGNKQSGLGREESVEEIFEFTQLKNVNIRF